MGTRYFRYPQAAVKCSVSVSTLRRHVKAGLIPSYRFGGSVLLAEADLDAYIASRRVAA